MAQFYHVWPCVQARPDRFWREPVRYQGAHSQQSGYGLCPASKKWDADQRRFTLIFCFICGHLRESASRIRFVSQSGSVEQPAEYHPRVRDLPAGERPVNRLREVGPTSISTTELLACLLQTPDALHQAQELLVQFGGLPGLVNAADAEIMQIKGVDPAQAARIKAALEFGRRLMLTPQEDRYTIRSPGDIAQLLMAEMSHLEQESFKVLC
jgi:hypothetical protein